MSGNTHVPDKLEGYLLQVRHALFELISVDDCVVSVEGYDDVAVENEDVVVAEQTKSVLSDNNPLANRSIAFWKTLYNWCDYVKNNAFPNKKLVLKYVVISTHTVKIGDIPKSFAKATTTEDAKKALEIARKEWFGDGVWKSVITVLICWLLSLLPVWRRKGNGSARRRKKAYR